MTRLALPNRRPSVTFPFEHSGTRYYVTHSDPLYGEVREIFLQGGKAGSDVEAIARDSAVAVSIALQLGASLQELQKSMTRDDKGSPAGPMLAALDKIARGPA
jgi:hypothetical protein